MAHFLPRAWLVQEDCPDDWCWERIGFAVWSRAVVLGLRRFSATRRLDHCVSRAPGNLELAPELFAPGFGGRVVIDVAFASIDYPAGAEFGETRIELFRGAAEIGVVAITEAEDGVFQGFETRSGFRAEPAPKLG